MDNIINLKDKVIVITGAASGIGREVAIVTSLQGARVIMLDISQEGLDKTLSLLSGEKHCRIITNLANLNELSDVVNGIVLKYGSIDGLVHCAGISSRKPLNVLKKEGFDNLMEVNFYSFVELVKLATKKNNFAFGGSIVAISSVSSIKGYKAKTEYCVSKAALDAAVRCFAQELIHKNIRVNTIMPGVVDTPMALNARIISQTVGGETNEQQPLGNTQPREIANLVAFLLSDATNTITGTSIRIDGGLCM